MEGVALNKKFWKDKRVLITGHTGFKGSWLTLLLHQLGAKIHGYALNPPTTPSLFELANIRSLISETRDDIRNSKSLTDAVHNFSPDIIFHLAAQPLVRESYAAPVETYSTNIMGTVNLFEAIRQMTSIKCVVNVTTDKCYENQEWHWGYRENEKLGGHDPYSSSKACSEIVTAAYRRSFFPDHRVGIASARAGNVIGGGDFAKDRLIPDCIRSALAGDKILIRYPHAIRPWQHVLEPLVGYMMLAEKVYDQPKEFSEAFNFGPEDSDAKPVEWIVRKFCEEWSGNTYEIDKNSHPHEAHYLKLDISKARTELGFQPRWRLEKAIEAIVAWTRAYQSKQDLRAVCFSQIDDYLNSAN
jgi:CDP-glucose 4,6-dehydratase